jgi:hypothetical protein
MTSPSLTACRIVQLAFIHTLSTIFIAEPLPEPHARAPIMDGESNQPTRTISDVAHSCIEMFHRCLARDRSAFAKLEGDERRFWAWSNSLNVFEEQQINLDSQLKKHAQIREMVLLLLGVLKDNLSLGEHAK